MHTPARRRLLVAALLIALAGVVVLLRPRHAATPDELAASLTLRAKLAQLLVVRFDGPAVSRDVDVMVRRQGVGAVVLYAKSGNIVDETQLRTLTATLQGASALPLVIAIDQEGGRVDRLEAVRGARPAASELAAGNDPARRAATAGEEDARDLAHLGIQLNLAPVVDVAQVENLQLAERTFGTTPEAVTRLAGTYLDALQASGRVVGTLKHFPGLGAVSEDPHREVPRLGAPRDRLESFDWQPYRILIGRGGVAVVMVTHLFVTTIDDVNPASLSRALVTGVLRDQLHFDGVVIADALTMKGVATDSALGDVALRALLAGADWLMGPTSSTDVAAIVDRLERAVGSGELAATRVDESLHRVLALKQRVGLLAR